jgi:hypothetical protein
MASHDHSAVVMDAAVARVGTCADGHSVCKLNMYRDATELPATRRTELHPGDFGDKYAPPYFIVSVHDAATEVSHTADVLGLDDKAMVPLGMPGLPVDTGARGPKGPVLAPIGQQLGALGSDSHRQGALVPSLTFV